MGEGGATHVYVYFRVGGGGRESGEGGATHEYMIHAYAHPIRVEV